MVAVVIRNFKLVKVLYLTEACIWYLYCIILSQKLMLCFYCVLIRRSLLCMLTELIKIHSQVTEKSLVCREVLDAYLQYYFTASIVLPTNIECFDGNNLIWLNVVSKIGRITFVWRNTEAWDCINNSECDNNSVFLFLVSCFGCYDNCSNLSFEYFLGLFCDL